MSGSPYPGLAPYTESDRDAARFFGRERELRIISANLRAARATLLYGPPGVGKSSLLRAGLIHRLRQAPARAVPLIAAYVSGWTDDPTVAIERALSSAAEHAGIPLPGPVAAAVSATRPPAGNGHGALAVAVADEPPPGTDQESLEDLLAHWCSATGARILLVLDQFEEYCLYHPPDSHPMDEELPRLIARRDLDIRVLISMREDELAALDRYKGRSADLLANRLRLDALSRAAGRDAIRRPVEWHNAALAAGETPVTIEPGLEDAVLDLVAVGRVALTAQGRGTPVAPAAEDRTARVEASYLQLVMDALWRREVGAGSSELRLATLAGMGGATEVVRGHVDAVMSRLSAGQQAMAAQALHFLVTPSGAKIAYSTGDLAQYAGTDANRLRDLLDRLCGGDARLLRRVAPQDHGEPRYELFHDVLAAAILDWRTRAETRRLRRRLRAIVVLSAALCAALAGALLYVADPRLAHDAEHLTLGARAGLGGPPLTPGRLVVVDFDRRSLRALHTPWPPRRGVAAAVIDRLRRDGARVIAYDADFAVHRAGDAALRRAVGRAGGRVVVGSSRFADDGRLELFGRPTAVRAEPGGVVGYGGFPNDQTIPGAPSIFRRMDARVRYAPDTLAVPTLSYLVARKAGLQVGAWRDPATIEYRDRFTTLPAIDVLAGRAAAAGVRGKVVLVGTTAYPGDIHPAPGGGRVSGLQIQASAILTTVSHARAPVRDVVLIALLALIPAAGLRLPRAYAVAIPVIAAVAYIGLAQLAYDGGRVLPVAVPLAVLAASTFATVVARRRTPRSGAT